MAIYPKPTHTLYGVLSGKTKWTYQLYLFLEPILFFSFFFSKLEHLILNLVTTITIIIILAPPLGVYQPSSYTSLMTRVSTLRFHQLAKTKLGLSEAQSPQLIDNEIKEVEHIWHTLCIHHLELSILVLEDIQFGILDCNAPESKRLRSTLRAERTTPTTIPLMLSSLLHVKALTRGYKHTSINDVK